MLMTNRKKQALDKQEIIAAHFVVSLQNSNIFIRRPKKKKKRLSCIFVKLTDQHKVGKPP